MTADMMAVRVLLRGSPMRFRDEVLSFEAFERLQRAANAQPGSRSLFNSVTEEFFDTWRAAEVQA